MISQLSRKVEERGGDKKPKLSDLRESGAIEQDADVVIFPYRPDYYDLKENEPGDLKNQGILIVAKHRHAGSTEIPFRHNDNITEFYDYEYKQDLKNEKEIPF